MLNLAWSNGIKAERSSKEDNPYLKKPIEEEKNEEKIEKIPNNFELEAAEMKTQIQVNGDYSLSRNTYRKTSNIRETSNNKLSERDMVSRACGNPFLTHLNYTDDIITQEQFLIPKNSNMENEYQQ